MKILDFCEGYNKCATQQTKDKFVKKNLEVKSYLPFRMKDALADRLVNISTYEYENYTTDNGELKRRKTGRIKVNSTVQYLLFIRIIIENYTNLEVATETFDEEYDALKQSGLLDNVLFSLNGNTTALLPLGDIDEFRELVKMKQNDAITNNTAPENYISNQIERISTITGITLRPVLDKIANELETMDDKKIEKLSKIIDKGLKRIK